MKISLLCENTSSRIGIKAEWGFSAFIEYNDHKMLFDTGFSDVYTHNAEVMDIDLNSADILALSHYHRDHTGGLHEIPFNGRKELIVHPDLPGKLPDDLQSILNNDLEVIESKTPYEFTEGGFFLGEIPRKTSFEKGTYKGDPIKDDTALAYKTNNGCVVISGCAHSGICNICEHAKEITGQKLYAVIGGFHLFAHDRKTVTGTIEYFKEIKPEHLMPVHCVEFPVLAEFHNIFNIRKYSAGEIIEF